MKYVRVSVQVLLLLALVVLPTLTAFASGHAVAPSECVSLPQGYSEHSTIPVGSCCPIAYGSITSNSSVPVSFDPCCITVSWFGNSSTIPVVASTCCAPITTSALTPHNAIMAAFTPVSDPCNQTCGLTLPDGSVVGAMPTDEQAYWA
ncbi:MAG TPA: hypothetical protein VHD90_19875, partial [Phototrophicaceae bacterium]|nr:hypothetical protein [Phototrophicaceae bacterium]